jgi:hypothetical protein
VWSRLQTVEQASFLCKCVPRSMMCFEACNGPCFEACCTPLGPHDLLRPRHPTPVTAAHAVWLGPKEKVDLVEGQNHNWRMYMFNHRSRLHEDPTKHMKIDRRITAADYSAETRLATQDPRLETDGPLTRPTDKAPLTV